MRMNEICTKMLVADRKYSLFHRNGCTVTISLVCTLARSNAQWRETDYTSTIDEDVGVASLRRHPSSGWKNTEIEVLSDLSTSTSGRRNQR